MAQTKKTTYLLLSIALALILILASCSKSSSGESGADKIAVKIGEELYIESCQVCHGDAATGSGAVANAPNHGGQGHTWHHFDGQLAGIILGSLDYPGRSMPAFQGILTEDEVLQILSYLETNWSAEQIEFQQEVSKNWEEQQRN